MISDPSTLTVSLVSVFMCIFSFSVFKYFWNRRRLYYYASKIKGPLSLPLIGSTYCLLGGTHNIIENGMRMVSKFKPLFKFWLGNKLMFVITRPEDIEIILNNCLEKEQNYKFLTPVFGNGLITLPVQEWKKHRRVIALTFNQQILNSFVDIFASYSEMFVERLDKVIGKGYVDLFPILTQCTLDIVCDTTMGTKVNAMDEGSQYILWTSRASELGIMRLFNILLHPNWIWKLTSMSKETAFISSKVQQYVREILENKKREKSQTIASSGVYTPKKKKIFLDYLIEITDQEGKWSDEESIEETRTIVVAGSDATALATCYVLMVLGMHQQIQDRVLEEIDSFLEITTENLQKMTYLDRVIKETLRIFPVAAILARYLSKDITLGSQLLPKDSSVAIPILYLHRDPDYWHDPLKFNPDRFLPEEVDKRHLYSYLPFSGGPRNCIGYRYAMMAMKTILATILRRYRVASTAHSSISDVKLKFDVATKCVGGQKVELVKRVVYSLK